MPPNFVLLDATLPDVTRLVAAMLQARAVPNLRHPRTNELTHGLRADARGRDGGVREELAAGVRAVSFWRYSGKWISLLA
jgi:hypothetical protein